MSEPAPAGSPGSAGSAQRRNLSLRTLIALILVIGAAAVATERGLAWREAAQRDAARIEAVEAAEAEVVGLISISADTTTADIDALIAGATSSFRDDLRQQADRLRTEVRKNRVEATGEVLSAAVADFEDDEATVIVAARGSVANKATKRPEPRSYRLEVVVQQVADRWLVSALRFVA